MSFFFFFPFPAFLHPNLFHHRSTQYYHHASGRSKENSQLPTETEIYEAAQNLAQLTPRHHHHRPPHPSTHIAPIIVHTRNIRAQSRVRSNGALACPRTCCKHQPATTRTLAGVLATALAAIERTQVDEEHDGGDVDALLSPVSNLYRRLVHKFNDAHLFAGHEGAPVPAKQQPDAS